MTRLAYAAMALILGACAAYAASALHIPIPGQQHLARRKAGKAARSAAPHDQARLTLRQHAAWATFRYLFGWDLRRQLTIAWLQELIEIGERRIREHLGEGGDI